MSRHTENKEELIKVHGEIKVIHEKLHTLEHNHLAHIKKDIDRILYVLGAVGLVVVGELFVLLNKVL